MSKHQCVSFAFHRLNCINMMLACHWPAISSMHYLGVKPTLAHLFGVSSLDWPTCLGRKPTLAHLFGRNADIGPPVWVSSLHWPTCLGKKPTLAHLFLQKADIGPLVWAESRHWPTCLGGLLTLAHHRLIAVFGRHVDIGPHRSALYSMLSNGPMGKSWPPTIVDVATPFIMLEYSASCHTSSSFFTDSFIQSLQP